MASIKVKGINNNLVFVFEEGSFEEYVQLLEEKFSNNQQLFNGSPVVFKGKGLHSLTFEDMSRLQHMCLDHGMILNNIELSINRSKSKDLVLYRNVRSGQKIHAEGSVVIWGDVHESAEIIAGNDIIVLGKMEGIGHAGFYGNPGSLIFAINVCPVQIRIAQQVFVSSADRSARPSPEVAYLKDGLICIEPYNARENLSRLNIL